MRVQNEFIEAKSVNRREMKIDRLKLKSRPSRLIKDSESAASKILLGRFEACNQNRDELNELLKSITTWQFGLVNLNIDIELLYFD